MRKISLTCNVLAVVLLLTVLSANSVLAHCEIPCGIYDDEMRCIAERTILKIF